MSRCVCYLYPTCVTAPPPAQETHLPAAYYGTMGPGEGLCKDVDMTPGPVMSGLLGWTLGNLVQGHAELSFPAMRWAIGYAWHEA